MNKNKKKSIKNASIDMSVDKTIFDDVKDTPEFKRGYEKEMLSEFAYEITRLRKKMGYSQQDIAVKAGTKQQVISRLESGVDDIKLSTFFRIANVLHMDLGMFVNAARKG